MVFASPPSSRINAQQSEVIMWFIFNTEINNILLLVKYEISYLGHCLFINEKGSYLKVHLHEILDIRFLS